MCPPIRTTGRARRLPASRFTLPDDERRQEEGLASGPRGLFGCGAGCGSFVLVILFGGALSLFNAVFGLGASIGIPFTQSNITAAGSIGSKDKILDGLPTYTQGRLAGNQNFINNSSTLTVGPAEGTAVLIVGKQDGAPVIDLRVVLR